MKVTGGIHILRHTFCSRLAMAGINEAIQELAGHEQISTTQRYMHLSLAAKNEAIALHDRGEDIKAEGIQDNDAAISVAEARHGHGAVTEQEESEGGAERQNPVVPKDPQGFMSRGDRI